MMGKKGSLKIDLGYDEGELHDDYFDVYDDDDDDENGDEVLTSYNADSKEREQVLGSENSRKRQLQRELRPLQEPKIRYYKPTNGAVSQFSCINDDVLIQICGFLRIRSISALGCIDSTSKKILNKVSLYFGSGCVLPCMQGMEISHSSLSYASKRISPLGIALELDFFDNGRYRDQIFSLVNTLVMNPQQDCRVCRGRTILKSTLSKSAKWCSYLSDGCEFISCKLSSTNTKNHHISKRRVQQIPGCVDIIASSLTPDLCAILSMPSRGLRRYVLTIFFTHTSDNGFKLVQQDIPVNYSAGTSSYVAMVPPSIKFDGLARFVVIVFSDRFYVFSVKEDCSLLWEVNIRDGKNDKTWYSWIVHDHYIIALTKKTVLVYNFFLKSLVSLGALPFKKFQIDRSGNKVQIQVFADRIWFACKSNLICTGMIFRRLQQRRENISVLEIKKFHSVLTLTCSSGSCLRCDDDFLYLADGNSIKIYYAKDIIENNFKVYQELFTKWRIKFFHADPFKVVCCITDEKKQMLEVVSLSTGSSKRYKSIFLKNSTTFCSRASIDFIQVRQNRLLVSYKDGTGKIEVRVFNLTQATD